MTDNEIVKALGCCTNEHLGCEDGCPYADVGCYDEDGFLTIPMKDALDLINRQKAELERKDIEIDILIKKKEALKDEVAELRAAVERLQDRNNKCIYLSDNETTEFCVDSICPEFKTEKMIIEKAVREFAEKLKEYFPSIAKAIDHTAEEMKGE